MIETAALDLMEIPFDPVHAAVELARAQVDYAIAVASENGEVAVVEVYDLSRLREDCRSIAGDVVLAVVQSDEQRAAFPRGNDLVRIFSRNDGDAVSPLDLPQRLDDCILEASVERFLDEVRQDFGVRLGDELVTALHELLLERGRVFDDPVMNNRDVVLAVDVRMRVALVRGAVRCPPGVGDPQVARDRGRRERCFEAGDFSSGLSRLDTMAVQYRNSR